MLHMHAGHLNQVFAMTHERTNFADRLFGAKRGPQQANRVQILKPLTIQYVGLAARNVMHVLSIDQMDFNISRLQDLKQWDPVDASGFHGHRVDATLLQPVRKGVQIFGECGKRSHRFGIPIGRYGDKDLGRPNINTAGVGSHYGQTPVQFSMLPFLGTFSLCLGHGSSPFVKFGNEPGVQNREISQAGSSQHKQRLRVTNVMAHGPGIKLLDGLAEASTNGDTIYAYRCRLRFCTRRQGRNWTNEKFLTVMELASRTALDTPWQRMAKEGWPRHQINGPVPLKSAARSVSPVGRNIKNGVVRATADNRWLERTTPSAPAKEASRLFLNGRSHPSFAKEGSSIRMLRDIY